MLNHWQSLPAKAAAFFFFQTSNASHTDEEVAALSNQSHNDHKSLLMPVEADIAPRLSPFSNLKERRNVAAQGDYSSSDESGPSRRTRPPRSKSPLIFSGNRVHESLKSPNLANEGDEGG